MMKNEMEGKNEAVMDSQEKTEMKTMDETSRDRVKASVSCTPSARDVEIEYAMARPS